jgi:hypothetical protein
MMLVNSLQAGVVWAHEPHDLCCTWVHNNGRVLDGEWCAAWWVLPIPLTHSLTLSLCSITYGMNDVVCVVSTRFPLYTFCSVEWLLVCVAYFTHSHSKIFQTYCRMNGVLYGGYCPIHSITFNKFVPLKRTFLETEWKAPTSSFILQG